MALNPTPSIQKTLQTPITTPQYPSPIIRATSLQIVCLIATSIKLIEQRGISRNGSNWERKTEDLNKDGTKKYHLTYQGKYRHERIIRKKKNISMTQPFTFSLLPFS